MNALMQMRYDLRLTPAELAERAGVAAKTIRAIEAGGLPQPETAGKIADVFEITPSEFLRRLTAGDPDGSRAAA